MKKLIMLLFLTSFCAFSQNNVTWKKAIINQSIVASKNVERLSFPKEFQLFDASLENLKTAVQNAPNRMTSSKTNAIITVPNVNGNLERFEVFEFSNMAPELQAQFPEIRSYVGKGIDDAAATIRFSIDPKGLQAMIFRAGKRNEFIEPYSADGKIYAVFNSSREKGKLPFTCSTEDVKISTSLNETAPVNRSSSGQLLTFRLALSCNGEYTTYHGATVAGALAAMNATMTRVNGVFEKDLAIHMNLITNNTVLIYTNAATDPYTTVGAWNGQLQSTLTSVIGEANYDIGHMFGSTGGGGSAGCIGCVCDDGIKGSGKTSPADGVPQGDNFDIDYVAHEMGHQFGGNHTFSHSTEGTGVNVEPGSGSTIMGYAGITSQDVQPHSDDYFVYATVNQIQVNMVGKTCPVRTNLTNNTPVSNAGLDYTIPKSTPFILDGSATDADPNDVLTYCWEQNNSATGSSSGGAASATKTAGPNWRSYTPVATTKRYCPPLARVIANQSTTQGTDIVVEALSSVARTLTFVLTARDNAPGVGQTGSDSMVVTVNGTAGPFLVSVPNTALNWSALTQQDVTWDVAGTTANGVNCATVDILLSTNGGNTYPITLATDVANDGLETITVPNNIGTTNRIMVRGHNHIFYDISNTNFTISQSLTDFTINAVQGTSFEACKGSNASKEIQYTTYAGFSGTTTFTSTGQPAGSTVTFSPNPISVTGPVIMTISNTASATAGTYPITVTATSGSIVKTLSYSFQLFNATFAVSNLLLPANNATAQLTSPILTWTADANATAYEVQVSTDANFSTIVSSGTATTNSFTATGLSNQTLYYWRIKPKNDSCSGNYSTSFQFTTGNIACLNFASANVPLTIATTANVTINSTLTIPNDIAITDINVNVDITHTWVRDLTVTLISPPPASTQIQLVVRPCTNSALNNIVCTFDDAGIPLICANNPAVGGIIIPTQALSALNGTSSVGLWTLRVLDSANADGGSLNSWSLDICGIESNLSVASNTINDLSIYPNPNNGNFNVQFNSQSSNEIKIGLYDISGRDVYSKSFQNNGFFNENLNLNNLQSGVYLIKIQDGEKQVTKKIIIE